jgi:hypothetical protein
VFLKLSIWSWDRVVGVLTRLWAGKPSVHGSILYRGKRFFSSPKWPDWLWFIQPAMQWVLGGSVPSCIAARVWSSVPSCIAARVWSSVPSCIAARVWSWPLKQLTAQVNSEWMPPKSMPMPSWHMQGKLHPSFALHYNYGTLSFSYTGKSPNKGIDNIPFFCLFAYI